ncbi:MAG: hypothetical protein VKM34_03020, partial [Cyanobacteriota bacterium]|nr:hypothetical protein [Cyanobacteriota bacterium]
MAQTIAFGSGGFNLADVERPGTEKLDVLEENGTFQLFNEDGTPIVGLGLQGSQNPDNLQILNNNPNTQSRSGGSSRDELAVSRLTANLEGGADRLVIRGGTRKSEINMQGGNDRFRAEGKFQRSDFNAGEGRNRARFEGNGVGNAARKSNFDFGDNDDLLVFGGNVKRLDIDLKGGADEARFRGDVSKTKLNLGKDDDTDVVKLSDKAEFSGFRIKGADENDVLFIGSSEYQYDGGRTWS